MLLIKNEKNFYREFFPVQFHLPETPYGGFKQSGVGKELGSEGLEEYIRTKNISIFTGSSLPSWYGKK